MQLLTINSNSTSTSMTNSVVTKRPKLSMIWTKEYKGQREILVAKWVVED
ncbi:hypothetical protein ACF3DV_00930 [Chlorogloeopsis fritschii PCC 9212]|jgi:hypothetical protein|uniref:Uncharacterized protein n=1 Tax=Chlorogloeopsis fritschii PCC 6912 TaxID=211165 RepID=A0A3S0XZ22_CHLFR|nr:hypothetical protein [Chlorogloeopsis fritschii]RUR80230.1 hypothetical protein PCC6912_30900 [Chlorogloeopsis fritschii PCC 6912]